MSADGDSHKGVKTMQALEQAGNAFVAMAAQFLVLGVLLTF